MTLLALLLIAGSAGAAPMPADVLPQVQPPPLDLAFTYRNWLKALQDENWDRAAAMVPPEQLAAMKEGAIRQIMAQANQRAQWRMINLGVQNVEELRAMTPKEFFVAVLASGGSPLPGFLRAATYEVLDGGRQGDRGWLAVRLSVSAGGGERVESRDIRQEFLLRDGKWLVSVAPVPKPAPDAALGLPPTSLAEDPVPPSPGSSADNGGKPPGVER